MNYYEMMYIIDSSLEPEEVAQVKKEVDDFLISEGSDIYSKTNWGRTRLAYEIEKQNYGYYIVVRFSAKPSLIKQLREKFGLMDAILSHLCTSLDEEPERIAEEEIKTSRSDTDHGSSDGKVMDHENVDSKDKKLEEKSEESKESKEKEESITDEVEDSA